MVRNIIIYHYCRLQKSGCPFGCSNEGSRAWCAELQNSSPCGLVSGQGRRVLPASPVAIIAATMMMMKVQEVRGTSECVT